MKFLPNCKERVCKDPINEINANTAFTTGCDKKKTTIFLFREEEWFKVFIHETFHNLDLDFIEMDKTMQINNKIRETFPISVSDIRSYEAYTEVWAEIMNMLFVVYFQDPPRKKGRLPFIRWIDTLASLVELQQTFSLFQANKILYYYDFTYSDLFIAETAQKYTEKTQVFSYYFLKSVWMFHINDFMHFCVKQPGGFSLKIYPSVKNIDTFIDKMMKLGKSFHFHKEMNEMFIQCTTLLNNVRRNKRKTDFITNTLRMTIHELV